MVNNKESKTFFTDGSNVFVEQLIEHDAALIEGTSVDSSASLKEVSESDAVKIIHKSIKEYNDLIYSSAKSVENNHLEALAKQEEALSQLAKATGVDIETLRLI
jgi:hypothetical protein